MKRLFIRAFAVLLFALILFPPLAFKAATGRVDDQAGLLSAEMIETVSARLEALCQKNAQELIFVTTADTGGKDSRSYAADYYDRSFPEEASGFIILLDMQNRKLEIVTQGNAIDVLRDQDIEAMLDSGDAALRRGDYGSMVLSMLDTAERFFERGVVAGSYREDEKSPKPPNRLGLMDSILGGLAGLGTGGAFYGTTKNKYKGKPVKPRYNLAANSAIRLAASADTLIDSRTTSRAIPQTPPADNSGNKSTTFTSSSGRTHGGGGRSF